MISGFLFVSARTELEALRYDDYGGGGRERKDMVSRDNFQKIQTLTIFSHYSSLIARHILKWD